MSPEEREEARRRSAGAMLLAADRAERAMRAEARRSIAQASQDVRRAGDKRAALLLALIAAGKSMGAGLAGAVKAGRAEARSLAARRLGVELRAAGAASTPSSPALSAVAHAERLATDQVEASVAADSLVVQWRGLATRAVLGAQRRGEDAAGAVSGTEAALGPRIARTAATEAARAFNDEHEARLREMAEAGDVDPDKLMREWSALVDACERCWPHDGERAGLLESFSGGDEPGHVHPRCACTEILVTA